MANMQHVKRCLAIRLAQRCLRVIPMIIFRGDEEQQPRESDVP